ncbi:MAG: PIN domain-containing protein [Patescibacteria group bacterium]
MANNSYTLDTNIVILHLKDEVGVVDFLNRCADADAELDISAITLAELLAFPALTSEAEQAIFTVTGGMTIVPVDETVAIEAGKLRRAYRLRLGDSIIAATVRVTDSTLITRDNHFDVLASVLKLEKI